MMVTTKRVFALGYHEAVEGRACETARQVVTRYPDLTWYEAAVYLNGADDGYKRDTFRLLGEGRKGGGA